MGRCLHACTADVYPRHLFGRSCTPISLVSQSLRQRRPETLANHLPYMPQRMCHDNTILPSFAHTSYTRAASDGITTNGHGQAQVSGGAEVAADSKAILLRDPAVSGLILTYVLCLCLCVSVSLRLCVCVCACVFISVVSLRRGSALQQWHSHKNGSLAAIAGEAPSPGVPRMVLV